MVERVGKESLEELRRESQGERGKGLWLVRGGELVIRQLRLVGGEEQIIDAGSCDVLL